MTRPTPESFQYRNAIISILKNNPQREFTMHDIAEILDLNHYQVSGFLQPLVRGGLKIFKRFRGGRTYISVTNHDGHAITAQAMPKFTELERRRKEVDLIMNSTPAPNLCDCLVLDGGCPEC